MAHVMARLQKPAVLCTRRKNATRATSEGGDCASDGKVSSSPSFLCEWELPRRA
jgi:hypothetical protein